MKPEEVQQANVQLVRAYQVLFGSPAGKAVLADLAPFCRANATCLARPSPGAPIDRERTFALEGRREVWLRIEKFMNLTPDEVNAYVAPTKDTDE